MEIGIALSGGGARGLAHIGFLKAFEEYGLKPSFISAVSAGSIIASFYCYGYSPKEMEEIALKTNLNTFIVPTISKKSFFSLDKVEQFLEKYIGKVDIKDLKTPLIIAATNLNKGKVEYFSSGNLLKIVKASCSIPVMFKPVKIDKYYYVDGGIMNNLPVEPLKDLVDFTIGVEVNPFLEEEKDFDNIISIGIRSFFLAIRSNIEVSKRFCDLFIQPPELTKIPLFATWKAKDAIEIGYRYSKEIFIKSKLFEKLQKH